MAATANINQDNTKMTPLLEEILVELKALRHDHLGVTANQPSSPTNKKSSTRGNSSQVSPIPSAKIMEIYENDQVKCRRNDGVIESLPRRIGTVEQRERWSLSVDNAWEVPEDGRLKLTFSKRSLLSLSSDTALRILEGIHKEDRDVPKWFSGGRTRIVDIFDDKTTKVYTIDPGASNITGDAIVARSPIDYSSQSRDTSMSGSSDPSPEPAFLDPDYQAKLFSDDEVLSRSKKYFWTISTLKELHTSISQNILQIRKLLEQEMSETTTEEESKGLRRVRAMLCSELREIENIASKLETKQEEATYLRDGSAWSVNPSFGYLNLLTANLLAAATYFLGFQCGSTSTYIPGRI
ncbi:hypothetical protein BPAE_0099g00190 [Botrytis paeoniae]|uniref:Uncharacterized protein n=1 Tax=Botrytis paeoniae TaxID=278948 RepID=A0A4Z1FQ24_9HELO|nr:hypothetical protein BPAE_0099g00190 [Botrytis paeoniae]